jgi:hypothetical protein
VARPVPDPELDEGEWFGDFENHGVNIARLRIDNSRFPATLNGLTKPTHKRRYVVLDYLIAYIQTHPWYWAFPNEELIKALESGSFKLTFWEKDLLLYAHNGLWVLGKAVVFMIVFGILSVGVWILRRIFWLLRLLSRFLLRRNKNGGWNMARRRKPNLKKRFDRWVVSQTHGKPITYRGLAYASGVPYVEKGVIMMVLYWWKIYGFRGLLAIWIGGNIRITAYPLFYQAFGQTIGEAVMNTVIIALVATMVYRWFRNRNVQNV